MKTHIINFIISLLAMIFLILTIYFAVAFANATFNISEWTQNSREVVSYFGWLFGITIFFITFATLSKWKI
jgi:phosphate starvation-inducible membrane PsiE